MAAMVMVLEVMFVVLMVVVVVMVIVAVVIVRVPFQARIITELNLAECTQCRV